MAETCNFSGHLEPTRTPLSWWSLLCEVLASHGFSFHAPERLPGTSSFTSYRYLPPFTGEQEALSTVIDSAEALREEVQREAGSVVACFWFDDHGEPCSLDVCFALKPEQQGIDLLLSLPGGQLREAPLNSATQRLTRFFRLAVHLCTVCQPDSGELYWEDATGPFAPWAALGTRAEALLEAKTHEPYRAIPCEGQQVYALRLGGPLHLFCFDPAPLRRRQGWHWVSLRGVQDA